MHCLPAQKRISLRRRLLPDGNIVCNVSNDHFKSAHCVCPLPEQTLIDHVLDKYGECY